MNIISYKTRVNNKSTNQRAFVAFFDLT